MTTRRLTWPAGLGRPPRWVWVLGAVLLLRAALPLVLRPIVAGQASKALHARVEIGDLDLSLLRGGIALEDVAVRPATATPDAPGGELPLVAWKRFALQVRWLPLLRRTVRLRRVELESPRVAVDRLPGGDFNLAALVPAAPAAPAEEKPPPSRASWGFGVDKLVLRDGWLRFRDLTIEDMEPVDLYLDAIEVADIALEPTLYEEPSRIHLEMRLDEGTLRLDALLGLRDNGFALETTLKAKRLPLRRTRVYIPHVGWRDLHGQLAAALVHRFETGVRNEVRGQAILQDVTVAVPGLDEPALTWKRLALVLPALDLAARRATVGRVELEGAALPMRLQGGVLLPLLAAGAPGEPATAAAAEPTPAPSAPEQTAPAHAPGWSWSVGSLEVRDSRLHLLGPEAPLEVGVGLTASNLAGDGGEAAPVRLALAVGGGSLVADGSVRVAPPGFEGRMLIEQLQLPELVAATGALPPHLLQKASLAGEVTIAAGSAAPTPGDVRVQGRLALAEPWLAAADPQEFAVGARGIDVGIEEVRVPGLLAAERTAADAAPVHVQLGELRIAAPYLQLTRTAEGLAVPPLAAEATPPTTEPSPAPAAGAVSLGVEVALGSLQLTEGRFGVTDQTIKPFYEGTLAPLEIDIQGLRWPELTVSRLRLEATSAERGKIRVTGAIAPAGGRLEVNGRDIALQPFNPYATTFSPYSISSGRLSLATKASFRKGRYDATSSITLHDFDLGSRGGDTLFQEQLGIPLSMALALLRDVQGNIVLDVPVEADEEGAKVGLLAVMRGALRRALVNALASPLKLVGTVFGGQKVEAIAPAPITFRPGRADLAPDGDRQVEQLAAFLAARPGIGVTLEAAPTARDARWLREQGLREELGRQGVLGALRSLPRRGAREAIRAALEARARDEEGPVDPGQAELLERWVAERPPIPPERLRALAEARLALVEVLLRERHGIGAERIARREPAAEASDDVPAVRLALGPAPRAGR